MNYAKITFSDTKERDEFIKKYFPKRKCCEEPGHYSVPNGDLYVSYKQLEYKSKEEQYINNTTKTTEIKQKGN